MDVQGGEERLPRVWILASPHAGDNTQLNALAEGLGWPAETKRLAYRPYEEALRLLSLPTLAGLDLAKSDSLSAPWPDLVLAAGRATEAVCFWLKGQNPNLHIVYVGTPWADPARFDLVIATPQYGIADGPTVLNNPLPLHNVTPQRLAAEADRWRPRLAHLREPYVALLVGGNSGPYVFTAEAAERLGHEASAVAKLLGGSLLVTTSARTPDRVTDALSRAITVPHELFRFDPEADNPFHAFLGLAKRIIVTADSVSMIGEAAAAGKHVSLFDIEDGPYAMRAEEDRPGRAGRPPPIHWRGRNAGATVFRALMNYTPPRFARDLRILHRRVTAAGLAHWLGDVSPRPAAQVPDPLAVAVARVRALLAPGTDNLTMTQDPSGLTAADRIAQLRGAFRKKLLQAGENLAYAVAGLPMAFRWMLRRGRAADDLPPADYLHRYYAATYWRLPLGPVKLVFCTLLWPIALAVAIRVFTKRNGKAIAERTGITVADQVAGQLCMAKDHAIAPFWFYMFELYRPERAQQAGLYLTAHETIGPAYTLLQPPVGADGMDDKIWFAEHCHEKGVRAVPVLMHFAQGRRQPLKGGVETLPGSDLFVKPRSGSGGHRMERWDWQSGDRYKNAHGDILTRDALVRKLEQQSLKDDYLVQPRLSNHAALDDISNGALATIRLLTCRNEEGRPEAVNAAFRMAIGNAVVDNFHQGGLATAVDFETGTIGIASDIGVRPDVGWRETHPVSGARFAGRTLPYWKEAVALAVAAHEAFPERVIVGWDVAMLPDGPMIIEGNGKPDLDIHQRAERGPLGNARIAHLLKYNVQKRLKG